MKRAAAAVLLLSILAAGAALRFRQAAAVDTPQKLQLYSRTDYYEFGRGLREFGVLGWNGSPDAFRAIAYPAFLSWLENYDPAIPPRVPTAHALLGSAAAPAAAWLALGIGGPPAALAAAALVSFHPGLLESINGCRIEVFYTFLILLVSVSLAAWSRHPTDRNTIALGFAIAVSLLCRGVLFALPVLLVAAHWRRPGFAERRRRWAWLLLASSYLFLLPWIARNAVQFGTLIPFEDGAASRNLFAASLGVVENDSTGPYQDILANETDPRGALREDPLRRMQELAYQNIAAHPFAYLRSCLDRLAYAMRHHGLLFLAAFLGFLTVRRDPGARALALLAAYFVLVHIPMTLEVRYFEPALPCLMILAACGVPRLVGRTSPAATGPGRAPLAVALILAPLYLLCIERLAAEVALTKIPCALPESALSLLRCGQTLEASGSRAGAFAAWRRSFAALEGDPAASPRLRSRLIVEMAAASPAGADRAALVGPFREILTSSPGEVSVKAIRLQDQGRLRDALSFFDLIIESHPRAPWARADRGVARWLARDEEGALEDFRKADRLDPGNPNACFNWGALLESRGRHQEALAVYGHALSVERPVGPGGMPSLYPPLMKARRDALRGRGTAMPR